MFADDPARAPVDAALRQRLEETMKDSGALVESIRVIEEVKGRFLPTPLTADSGVAQLLLGVHDLLRVLYPELPPSRPHQSLKDICQELDAAFQHVAGEQTRTDRFPESDPLDALGRVMSSLVSATEALRSGRSRKPTLT